MTDTTRKPMGYADYRKIANRGATAFRNANQSQLKPGLQAQHWFKVKESSEAKLDAKTLNSNFSLLQSHGDKPATTMLTSTKGGGTTYTVGDKTYVAEHGFADNHLIPAENQRMLESGMDKAKAIQSAGASARWKMTGATGPVDPKIARTVNIAGGERLQASARGAAPASGAKPASRPAALSPPKGPNVGATPAGPKLAKPGPGPAAPGPGPGKTGSAPSGPAIANPSAPKIAPATGTTGGAAGSNAGPLGGLMKPGGTGRL